MKVNCFVILASLVLILLLAGCSPGDAKSLGDLYTQNMYPGTTDTYDVGSAALQYDGGYFREVYINGILLVPGGGGPEADPVFTASAAAGIVAGDIIDWDTAFGWGNHASAGYLTANQNITLSGDITGSGTTSITATLKEWATGNVTYVPLTGDIQTYVNNAAAGDTLILASGEYAITSTITVNKQLNIVGQGSAGLYTIPVAPAHGTVISSVTAAVTAFKITASNVRLAFLSVNLTGAGSTGIRVDKNLTGVVIYDIDVIITSDGVNNGFYIYNSDVIMRGSTFYITSNTSVAAGVYIYNDNTSVANNVVDCFDVTGTAKGGLTSAYAFACFNNNTPNTLTLNLSSSVCKALAGTVLDCAVIVNSAGTNNAIVNAYMCTFDGQDYDAYQTGTNQMNIGGSVLVNNLTFGTITYRAALASNTLVLGTPLPITSGGTGQITKVTAFDALSPMTTLGDMISGGAGGTGTRLVGDTSNTRKYLSTLSVGGVATAPTWETVAVGGASTLGVNDDIALSFGTSTDVSVLYETADANANELIMALPNGGATDVPVLAIGDQSVINKDLTYFNGITVPTLAILDATEAHYIKLQGTPAIGSDTTIAIQPSGDTTHYLTISSENNLATLLGTGGYLRVGNFTTSGNGLASPNDLFVSGKFDVAGASYYGGVSTFSASVTVNSSLTMAGGNLLLQAPRQLGFANPSVSSMYWDTADANANLIEIYPAAGTTVKVPVIQYSFGGSVDQGLFDGLTQPLITTVEKNAKYTSSTTAYSDAGAATPIMKKTGVFGSSVVGDIVRVTAGTNATVGWYYIAVVTSANQISLDRNWCTANVPNNGVFVAFHSFTMLSAQGLNTRITYGAPSDSNVEIAKDGWLILDTSIANGRLYWRANNGWHYVDATGGVSFTANELVDATSHTFKVGDMIGLKVDQIYYDNSFHAVPVYQTASGATWGSITGTLSAQLDLQGVLDSKQNASANLTSMSGLSYASPAFVKMTGANTFTLDTTTYLSSTPSWKNGQTTKNLTDASTTQNIAHGLGRVPKYVHIRGLLVFSASVSMEVNGYYDGTNQSGEAIIWTEGSTSATTDNIYQSTAAALGFSNAGGMNPFTGATKQSGVITVDGTNIIITWTKSGSPTGTANLAWECQ